MKNLIQIGLLLALVASFSSCEKIKGIFDVEFDTTLSGDLDIDIQEPALKSAESYSFQAQDTIDPMDDEDIAEYIDNIREMNVDDVVATVLKVDKEDVVFKSGTSFTISDNQDIVTWTLAGDWPIMKGTELTLQDLGDTYKAVAEILNRKSPFIIGTQGTCNQTNVNILIKLGIVTEVVANPL